MLNGYDIAYYLLLGVTWPLWALRRKTREKVRDAFATRDGSAASRPGREPAVLVHAVSVGELNAARALIERLQAERPELHVIVTTTTKAGDELARKLYGRRAGMTVLRFPVDLSANVSRMLDALRPTLVVLMELEVWPNFIALCERRQIPVVIANGRVTAPSFKKYRLGGPLVWRMFRRLEWCVAQDETYAERFAKLGVPRERLIIAGTMKFDAATVGETVPGADELARDMGLQASIRAAEPTGEPSPVWVAGSTGPGEESIVLDIYGQLLESHPTLRLAIIPRKPERFDEVAALIAERGYACARRSTSASPALAAPSPGTPGQGRGEGLRDMPSAAAQGPHPNPLPAYRERGPERATGSEAEGARYAVILGDTMGELRKFYALADVVFVGRTLVDLGPKQHGSDMIEPAALGKPTIVGPFTGNFEEPMRAFRSAEAMVEIVEPQTLYETLDEWLGVGEGGLAAAREIGRRAQHVVIAGKGSVTRHVELLLPLLT